MKEIVNKFLIEGSIKSINEHVNGLVNKTYLVTTTTNKYLLQKINKFVFSNPKEVMENINTVLNHFKSKNIDSLEIVKCQNNLLFYYDNGEYFRMYKFMNDSLNVSLDNDKVCLEVGKAIGNFQLNLIDLDSSLLNITIPNFHNFLSRLNNLIKKYNDISFQDIRKFKASKYFNYIISNSSKNMIIGKLLEKNIIPTRIVHNDTKLNNIMFYKDSLKAKCLIDLDTVMPGSVLFDFGDACRTSIVSEKEDSKNLENIDLCDKKFVYLSVGYLSKIKNYLKDEELNLLVDSIGTIILECATRFLTDYLDHDQYFKIDYEEHNLDRVINQITLYKAYLKKEKRYKEIINSILLKLK